MPRLSTSNPKYRKHTSGRAVVTIAGKDIYLGTHGTKASKAEYDRVIAEYLAASRRLPIAAHEPTVNEILLAFWKHAKAYYRKPVLNADGLQKLDANGKAVTEPTTADNRGANPQACAASVPPALRPHARPGLRRKSVNSNVALKVLGVTATPDRADELALGKVFDKASFVYTINDGIEDG